MRNAVNTQELLQKWAPMLEAGEKIEKMSTKKVVAQLLENTARDFAEHGMLNEAMGVEGALGKSPLNNTDGKSAGYLKGRLGRFNGNDDADANRYLPNVIMPMVRRIFPSLIAHELVGVQALNGPIGYALAYRAKIGTQGGLSTHYETLPVGDREMAYAPVDTRYTGVSSENKYDLSSAGEADKNYWNAYAGDETGYKAWSGQGIRTEQGEFLDYINEVPTVDFDFRTSMVEARTRKLGAGWSPEVAEDMEAIHGFDIENEFTNMITYQIGAEIDRQLITEMVKTAITGGMTKTWDPKYADGLDQMGRLATLLTQVTIEANQIAVRTRRGHANFVVTSPRVTALLEQLSMNKFVSIQNTNKDAPSVPDSGVGVLAKVGLINDGQQLLIRDTYANGDYILMGYKGQHPADNGIIYCPYIPVQLSKVINPRTFTPMIGARTRYGVMNSVWDARNYYTFLKVNLSPTTGGDYTLDGQRNFVQSFTTNMNGTLFV